MDGIEVEAVTAFLADTAGVVDGLGRGVDNFDQVGASVLAGAARGEVVRVAGDPEMGKAVAARRRPRNGSCTP